ncbi:MAG: hypothetical protein A4E49_00303 [Methanosaeta sp. PtaU1.Bin112]|nr:MAG: hypothetical protein A4E49_00303 [Methanosaeta sp. PtaU1.Bin112]
MPPTKAALKARGWSDKKIDAFYAKERTMDKKITKMIAEGKTMIEILGAL